MAAVVPSKYPTLEEVAPVAARQRTEAKRQLPIDILLTLVSGGVAPITRGQAGRAITRGALEQIKPRGKALEWARRHLKGLVTVPKEHLDPIEKYFVEPVGKTIRGQFGITGSKKPAVLLNPLVESSMATVPHENIMHYLQYFPQDPTMKRMLKPVMEQITKMRGGNILQRGSAVGRELGTMIERHAREGTRRILREAVRGEKKIPRSLGKKRTEEIFEASLRAVLESEGWAP